jgi:plasmid stability protein
MANQDDFVKTALRLPRGLHARIQASAAAAGRSMNAEIIDRLQADPGDAAVAAMIDRLRGSDEELLETTRKQRDLLWNVVDRAEDVLNKTDELMRGGVEQDGGITSVQQSIGALRDLIATIKAYR